MRFNRLLCLVWFQSLVFALVVNLPRLVEYFLHGGLSPRSFTDNDEILYLRLPYFAASLLSNTAIYFEHSSTSTLFEQLFSYRSGIVDFVVGKIATLFQLAPITLGLFLDILCSMLAFMASVKFFALFSSRYLVPQLMSCFFLVLVFIVVIIPFESLPLPTNLPFGLVSPSAEPQLKLPITRGVYTQISYPLFVFSLFAFFSSLCRSSKLSFLSIGLLGGLQFVIYPFAGVSFLAIVVCFFVLLFLSKSWLDYDFYLVDLMKILLGWGLLVALYLLLNKPIEQSTFQAEEFSHYWYFSLGELFVIAGVWGLASRLADKKMLAVALMLAAAALVAEYAVVNIQPILGVGSAPYRFQWLYLRPLACAGIACVVVEYIAARVRPQFFSFAVKVFFSGLIVCQVLGGLGRFMRRGEIYEIRSLVEAVQEHTEEDSVLSVMPYENVSSNVVPAKFFSRTMPLFLTTQSNRYVYFQDWLATPHSFAKEEFERELVTSWLYTGEPALLWPCSEKVTEWPGDIFYATLTYLQVARVNRCAGIEIDVSMPNLCRVLGSYRLDYVVWERELLGETKPWFYQELFELVWQSESAIFELYRFPRQEVLKRICS